MSYSIRLAFQEDAKEVYRILKTVAASVKDPAFFIEDTLAYVQSHIEEEGFILIAMKENTMAAFFMIHIPKDLSGHLGLDVGMTPGDLKKSAVMDVVCVLKEHRGHGLQQILLLDAEKECVSRGLHHALATVHPDNAPSLKSFLKHGYTIKATKEKYGGVLRHILYKKLL
ncbi:GNAT family N-acetyltransferase [Christensenellaceae bacterium OttesenSCG-928-M15]|nr:GNAT family N-acetyltransferase [Christensenellaceae bacterium OttesenSCG-928-M15]